MGVPYDVHAVEARWRARWEVEPVGRVDLDAVSRGEVFSNLVEFPYPSAEGLHVGHVFKYGGVDVLGRYWRMRGRQVFQPIGFDAFGINAENFALRAGVHPRELIARTTASFRRQLTEAGMAWDWSRCIDTSRPDYYRWTQWVFLRLFRAGLAYQAEAPVLWCPSCLTVLAREQLEGDACERCGTSVAERVMRQWFLRITAYADRLLDGLDGLDWPERAKRLQRQWIGRVEVAPGRHEYRLHDWLISRQRYWGPPIPIVHCPACGAVPVPDDQLPVLLPHVEDFRPTGTGLSPLAAVAEFVETACPACRGPARRETDVSDTFVDSSWYFLRYTAPDADDRPWDAGRVARALPADFYAGGPEHVQRHHLYARFVTMALHDLGLVPFAEPFPRVRLGGFIVKDGHKMSKTRGNVVNPDGYVAAHGADVLRCHLLFSGPWEAGGDFREAGIAGIERFLTRAWRVVTGEWPMAEAAGPSGVEVEVDAGATVAAVSEAVEALRFNVALAEVMRLARTAEDALRAGSLRPGEVARVRRVMVLLLAPFAPHLAEELWERLGGPYSVHVQQWPAAGGAGHDPGDVVVQVDGRRRHRFRPVPGTPAGDVEARALAWAEGSPALAGRRVVRVVHVPDRRLVNVVTEPAANRRQ